MGHAEGHVVSSRRILGRALSFLTDRVAVSVWRFQM